MVQVTAAPGGAAAGAVPDEAELVRFIGPEGELCAPLPGDVDDPLLVRMYRHMVRARLFDRRAVRLQRQGRLGTYAPLMGQEACQVGSALALGERDWLLPTYRDHGATLARGLPMTLVLLFWRGREEGNDIPPELPIFPVAVAVASQLPHAVGLGMAARMRGDPVAALVYFGDGATSEGEFHEAMNFAGVFQAPVVFFCQNNGFAISTPLHRQTAAGTLASRAAGYGLPAVRVDGNDAAAVYVCTRHALERARRGGGPTFIEACTYRLGPHTTSDDPSRYRSAEEERRWAERDPLRRLRRLLEARGLWDEAAEAAWQRQVELEMEEAVRTVESMAPPDPDLMFTHAYATLPARLARQREELAVATGGGAVRWP